MTMDASATLPAYVVITPARNEARFIERTIESVVAQRALPLRWIVVSDGSTDGTDDIVMRHAAMHPWIELVRTPTRLERHFAGKVLAFNAGYLLVKDLPWDAIASLDADISFDEEYFSFLLGKLAADPALGLVGTPFQDHFIYDYRFVSDEHVSGACQLFRRACFEDVGGYVPVKGGGIDHIAVVTARMKGWKTKTFTDKVCLHHRAIGSARHGSVRARFRDGVTDFALGAHPLWEVCRTMYQMTRRPRIAGGAALFAGFLWSAVRGRERPVGTDFVRFRRDEQMRRLRAFITRRPPRPLPACSSGTFTTR